MALSAEYAVFVEELFAAAFPIRIRRMFGGAGIFSDDLMIGLISDERIYLKVDESTRARFEAEGAKPFVFSQKSGEIVALNYLELPDRLYDEPDEFCGWAVAARDVALRSASAKKRPATRKTRTMRGLS